MATLNEIVTILAERVGRQYDLIFKRELKVIVNNWRGTILRQALKDSPKDASFFQVSWQMEVVQDYIVKCPFNYGCVMRTKDKIPQGVRITQFPYSYIGTPTLDLAYTYVYPNQLKSVQASRNNRKDIIYYTILNGYGYFYNMPALTKWVGLQGIPSNLDEVTKYQKCGSGGLTACYSDDSDYPMTSDLIQRIIQSILSVELRNQVKDTEEEVKVNGSQS